MGDFSYGFSAQSGSDFDTTLERVKEALKEEGFGVLTTIDVKAALKEKLDVDFRRYVILGACNPPLAHQALQTEEHIGLLLPCNVVVQESTGGGVVVSIGAPQAMFDLVDNPTLEPVAGEAEQRLRRVIGSVS